MAARLGLGGSSGFYPRFATTRLASIQESASNMALPPPGDLQRVPKLVNHTRNWVKKLYEPGSRKRNVKIFPYKFPRIIITNDEFFEFCNMNSEDPFEFDFERTAEGGLVIMPAGAEGSKKNARVTSQVFNWNEQYGTGEVFDSSGGFTLPNGAVRSPDTTWIQTWRWMAIAPELREEFPPICPDFVVEVRSKTDKFRVLQTKMEEYIENGCALSWLIDPLKKEVYIYQPNTGPVGPKWILQKVVAPKTLRGDPVLPGFVMDFTKFW